MDRKEEFLDYINGLDVTVESVLEPGESGVLGEEEVECSQDEEIVVLLTDIPYSGGAHMMPGAFGMIEKTVTLNYDYDAEYVSIDDEHHDGRQEKGLVLAITDTEE